MHYSFEFNNYYIFLFCYSKFEALLMLCLIVLLKKGVVTRCDFPNYLFRDSVKSKFH
jgi:hypothetical protein